MYYLNNYNELILKKDYKYYILQNSRLKLCKDPDSYSNLKELNNERIQELKNILDNIRSGFVFNFVFTNSRTDSILRIKETEKEVSDILKYIEKNIPELLI